MARKILRSEAPQNDREGKTAPPNDSALVILSAAKNLFSWPRGMAQKILRSEAPQNDREEETVPPNDSSLVILSEAKNLPSRLRGMAPKILRSEAPQNDREGKPRLRMTAFLPVILSPHCHSERSEESFLPSQGHGPKDSSEQSSSE